MQLEEIRRAALKLDLQARARLARALLESLDDASDQENLKLWVEEAERRDREWTRSGEVGIPSEELFPALRSRLRE